MASTEFKRELLLTGAIWAFLMAGAGVYFGLKHFLKPSKTEDVIVELKQEEIEEPKAEDAEVSEEIEEEILEEEPKVAVIGPSPFAGMAQNENGTNSTTTYNAVGHIGSDGIKYIYYKTLIWGTVAADFEDFREKVSETLNDARGWIRAGLKFVEVTEGQDLNIILSDALNLEGYNGYCSGSLSCTSGYNEVIINDERWRLGTSETTDGGMSIRDYQTMVINHEVGHWLGHYNHVEACEADGDIAPIMLQQSTGLRNCGQFNPWPLDSELWTLR